jgi:pyruvate/2-oxoglutarate dehydrogenase complex dihydrolipoamide acyltransferase (E2) component
MGNKMSKGYRSEKLSFYRKMVIASVRQNKNTAIHCVTEIDITQPRSMIKEYFEEKQIQLSFTAFITYCLAQTLKVHPEFNSFLKGNRIVYLDDISINVLVERTFEKESVPEPLVIAMAQSKTLLDIHHEIRNAQNLPAKNMGDLTGSTWINLIPGFLLKPFVKLADSNVKMAKKYGKVAITAVGMFSKTATWVIPHGTSTVLLTVGSISERTVSAAEGFQNREFLHLTASFDHEIIDGAPAARFMQDFTTNIEQGLGLQNIDQRSN